MVSGGVIAQRLKNVRLFAFLFFPIRNRSCDTRVRWHTGEKDMPSNARIFLAGVLTTFVILAVGFGGGLMLAQSALKEPSGYQSRASSQQATPVRVILPASAEPAQSPQPSTDGIPTPEPQPQAQPVKEVHAAVEKQVESVETRQAEAADERRERRRHYAERKSKRMAARAKQQMDQMRQRPEPGILAFGRDESAPGGYLGN
jgi:hypothetical protein